MITKLIRQSNKMSHEADELDTKIGLLIQNRISLQVKKLIQYYIILIQFNAQ